jgi:DNA-binding Lrp family transcriptional regulator
VKTRPDVEAHRVRAVMSIAIEGERSGAVIKALKGFPEVAAIHTTNGRWDLIAELDVETLAAFSATLDAIRQVEGIASTETSILLATQKL